MLEIDLTWIIISITGIIGALLGSKMVLNHQTTGSKYSRSKVKELEEYTEYLKKQMRVYKNKASNIDRGPSYEGNIEEIDSVIPNIVGEFADYAPKWLKPILKDKESQKWILDYIGKNPDKAKEWFGKLTKKSDIKGSEPEEAGL